MYIFGTDREPGTGDRETFVVVASMKPLDLQDLGSRADDPKFFKGKTRTEPKPYGPDDEQAIELRSRNIFLTDDYAAGREPARPRGRDRAAKTRIDEPPTMAEGRPKPDRTWLYITAGFVVFWILYLVFFGPRRRAALDNSGMSQPAAYNWSLLDLDDQPVPFSRFQGKAVFLNIWATWCGPCVGEMPSIAQLARDPRLQGKNIEFVCVSTDDSSEVVRRFLQGRNWTMTFLRAEQLPPVFQSDGIPITFVIAADGRIVASELGAVNWHEPRIVSFLEKLAAAPAQAR